MLSTRRVGHVILWAAVLGPLLIWAADVPDPPTGRRAADAWALSALGQLAGLTGMSMLAVTFVLSARLRWLEDVFGGLDSVYRLHHRLGLWAFGLLVAHPLLLAGRFLPTQVERAVLFVFPTHNRWAVNLGVYAFWLMALLLLVTVTTWLPYDKWKISHKGLALVMVGGAVHMWALESTRGLPVAVAENAGLWWYMTGIVGVGLLAAGYKTLLLPRLPQAQYSVSSVERLNDDVLAVRLSPVDDPLDAEPGQFVFVTFHADDLSREQHPYTLCGPPDAETETITVKALGDYTSRLYERLSPGTRASLEGPYGRFDYRDGGRRQIWIAGGVGVAPFLSWARTLAHEREVSRDIDFYYCVHDRSDAVYQSEFDAIGDELPSVRVALVCSVEEGHLHARDLEGLDDADIFMCGPKRLTRDLYRQLRGRGVPPARIHFEDFEFR